MPYAEDAGRLIALAMRLEADALVALAQGDAEAAAEAQRDLETVFAGLSHRGVAYPPHAVAARFGLDGASFAALSLALMPAHAPERLLALTAALGQAGLATPTLALVATLVAPPAAREAALEALRRGPLFAHALVREAPDGALTPSPAVLELLGLQPPLPS